MLVQFIFLLVATHTTLDVVSAKLKLVLHVVAIQNLCIGLHCPKSLAELIDNLAKCHLKRDGPFLTWMWYVPHHAMWHS
jgi:hypothetical protein